MIEISDSKWVSLATVSILGQSPRGAIKSDADFWITTNKLKKCRVRLPDLITVNQKVIDIHGILF